MASQLIPISDAIAGLREQLQAAMAAGEGQVLRFDVGPVDLEFNVVAEREGNADAKVQFKIFGWGAEVGAGGKLSDQRTQTIKLTLTPVTSDGGSVRVSSGRR